MCRWLAFSGSPVHVDRLLLGPKNSLIAQSLNATMGATVSNGDGFGLGWYGEREAPTLFHSIEPAWSDRNLRELVRAAKLSAADRTLGGLFGLARGLLIIGLTATGRASERALHLNRRELVNLRYLLSTIGEHPPDT